MWEYKILWLKANHLSKEEEELNKLGNDNWELVNVVPITYGTYPTTETISLIYYLKRKLK